MKMLVLALWLLISSFTNPLTCVVANGQSLNSPIPESARQLYRQGIALRERDQFEAAVIQFKKAIATAPNYVQAHIEYVRTRAFFQHQYDRVRAEYDALMAQEPDNPVYVLLQAMILFRVGGSKTQDAYKKVAQLAPAWAWGHYAMAVLSQKEEPEKAIAELRKCIGEDNTGLQPYYLLSSIQKKLGRIDDAIETAKSMADQHGNLHLSDVWQLQLVRAKESDEAKASLKDELVKLAGTSSDLKLLGQIRFCFSGMLKDPQSAGAIENKILGIDPGWYPERGQVLFTYMTNEGGVPRSLEFANRQFAIFNRVNEIDEKTDPKGQVSRLERLLSSNPERDLRAFIYQRLFHAAEKAGALATMVKYGKALYAMDRTDSALLAKIGIALADSKVNRAAAIRFARNAEHETAEFRSVERPSNVSPEWFDLYFNKDQQLRSYKQRRALALESMGWVLHQRGNEESAKEKLLLSLEVKKTESNLSHLSQLLRKEGRAQEAEKLLAEASNLWIDSVKSAFTNEPAKEFELIAIDNRRIKLSELKGKVVMLNFWATWCGPCIEEFPGLIRSYEKYKDLGFEILAISVDSEAERYKVPPFAKKYGFNFPVLFNEGVEKLYDVNSYPTNVFIDREGKVRYRQGSFTDPHRLEAVVQELLK